MIPDQSTADGQSSGVTRDNIARFAAPWSVEQYARGEATLFPHEARQVAAHFPPPPARVLDLGCGAGRTTIPLAALGYTVTGIDLSPELIAEGKERAPTLDLRVMDASQLEFADQSFDAALFSANGIDCIYPLAARERCLREVRRVLRPGAPFVMSSNSLVGRWFSGGFFYLAGHLRTARFLLDQLGNPLRRERYFSFRDGSGRYRLYFGNPSLTMGQLRTAGFVDVQAVGRGGQADPRWIYWHEAHVQYAARVPR